MAATLACARAGVTTGEWAGVLREVFGEYRAPTGVSGAVGTAEAGEDMARVRGLVRRTDDELGTRLRMLVGKPGLDGHSNGAEQIAVRARDAGFEVVYQGIRLTPAQIVSAAVEEDVHVVGLSILSGSHRELVPDVLRRLREAGAGDVPVVVGGIIPEADAALAAGPGRGRGLHAEGLRHHRDHRSYRRGRPRRSRPRLTSRRQKGLHLVLRPVTTALRHVAVDVRPLRHAAFRRLFVGQGVAFVGFQLTAVAVPVQMYAVTGSSFWVGLIGLAALVPLVVFGLYGGSVSDAVDRRRLLPAVLAARVGRHRCAARAGPAAAGQPVAAAGAGGGAVRRVRAVVAGARRDPASTPAGRPGAGGEHPELHHEQCRSRRSGRCSPG